MGLSTGAILALTSLGGAGISAGASLSAAGTEASAAQSASQLEAQEQQQALQFEEQEFGTEQAEEMPWIQSGQGALSTLNSLLAPGGQLTQGYGSFTAPSLQQAEQNPGYQFSLQQGEAALQASAAAQGGLLTGGMSKALTNYGQQAAQSDYQQVYNNALDTYNTNFNTFNTNQNNLFNRYASLAGLGQQAASTAGSQGTSAANSISNTLLTGGSQVGQDIQNAAYQTGSGYAAAGNALGSGLSSLGSLLSLQNLLNPQTAAASTAGTGTGLTSAGYNPNTIYTNW